MSFAWGTREREKEKKNKQDHWLAKKEFVLGFSIFSVALCVTASRAFSGRFHERE
jgi:hypothetical protein